MEPQRWTSCRKKHQPVKAAVVANAILNDCSLGCLLSADLVPSVRVVATFKSDANAKRHKIAR